MKLIRRYGVSTRHRQAGLSLMGLLAAAIVIAFGALVAMKIVPSALEYQAIRSAVNKVVTSGANEPREVQRAFDQQATIDDITSIRGSDLIVERVDGSMVVSFAYEKRIPLFGPASLVLDYQGSSR